MTLIKKKYDNTYFNTWIDKLPLEKKFNEHKFKLIHQIKPSGNLLEIGCGRGKLLAKLDKYYFITGVDISPSAIKEASKLIDKKHLSIFNIEKKPITNKYDIILAFDVLEHLTDPETEILKIKNALKKNGVFIFSVPNNYGIFGKIMTLFFNYMDKTHISTYERNKWIEIIKHRGFKIEVYNQHSFGISKKEFIKHFAFNLIIVAYR